MADKIHRLVRGSLYLVFGTGFLILLGTALPYYLTPLGQRPRHELYWVWKPGGEVGILLGVVGAGMMTLMLLYSIRKRLPRLKRLGRLSYWLDYHIVLGIFGPLLIVLHSSFKVGGLVSIAFWSMLVVAGSGIFGRYLYVMIPRSVEGVALSREAVWKHYERVCEDLQAHFPLPDGELERLRGATEAILKPNRSVLLLLLTAPRDRFRLRALLKGTLRQQSDPKLRGGEAHEALGKAIRLHSRALLLTKIRALFHYWHVFHKPFAVVMYLLMMVHVGVAIMTGYGPLGPG